MKTILITGGAGFIGSNFVHHILDTYPDYRVKVLDKLTYAGNLDNLRDVMDDDRFTFIKGDICDKALLKEAAEDVDYIVNFAAETHVDRSILDSEAFIRTDVLGTYTLLETVRELNIERFVQISTDEVYGSITEGSFKEDAPLNPSSPYAASKAGADMLVNAYWVTYRLPVIITRSSNNYGPYQYPEKLIPLFITNALEDKPLPLYGDGMNVRDWLYVKDNCEAIDLVLHKGEPGRIYNIGGDNERTNIEITRKILAILGKPESLIRYVTDRKGHDRRYSIDSTRIHNLGWHPRTDFDTALEDTVHWYVENRWWWERVKSGEFQRFYKEYYKM
ncbi:dTDP-glucose 4,6-dehydratase [Candidatus Sumerlaeota bacterium]|nr:dTDP-glucose 4,6-dehydratase [Candidatus Sumerlaeota bacterium]